LFEKMIERFKFLNFNMSGVIILNCTICGAEVEVDEQQCSKCREMESKVQVLTLEEKQDFSGITLVQDQQEEQEHYEQQAHHDNRRMYAKQFSISGTSLLTKLVLGIILVGVIFVALPIAIFFISIVALISYIVRK